VFTGSHHWRCTAEASFVLEGLVEVEVPAAVGPPSSPILGRPLADVVEGPALRRVVVGADVKRVGVVGLVASAAIESPGRLDGSAANRLTEDIAIIAALAGLAGVVDPFVELPGADEEVKGRAVTCEVAR
jgi:hypothetical protein